MGGKRNRHLIVFTRFPESGTTKTRLVPSLGADGAARLQRRMTEHLLQRVGRAKRIPKKGIEIRYTGGNRKRMQSWLGPDYRYRPQGRGDLGARMSTAFDDAFQNGAGQIVLIGTDIPGITAATIDGAFDNLAQADGVFGPARDGGYYLIGLSHKTFTISRNLFTNIRWGSGSVLADTLKMTARQGLRLRLLEELADVDHPEDLHVWEEEFLRSNAKG